MLTADPDPFCRLARGQGAGSGYRGTILKIQYVVDAMDNRGYGVAKNSRGNLYQLRF